MTPDQALDLFKKSKALLEGHFRLTSGLHSPQYFQCAKVLQYPEYAALLCRDVVKHFAERDINCVISPAIGGIVVGTEVGRQMGVRTIFAERQDGVMSLRRGFELSEADRVLVVEDVVTTGGSVREVIDLVRQFDATVAGVGFLVDRSGKASVFDVEQHAVFKMDVITYDPQSCPLCEQGLPVEKPGSRNVK